MYSSLRFMLAENNSSSAYRACRLSSSAGLSFLTTLIRVYAILDHMNSAGQSLGSGIFLCSASVNPFSIL